jgi:CelD/BcsL family acetyltransferase involved in cellulose biosynthesis
MTGPTASLRTGYSAVSGSHRTELIAIPGAARKETPVPDWKSGFRGEVLRRDAVPMLLPAWKDLCGRACEDNVYYSPRYAQALLESVDRDKEVGIAVVWEETRLHALLPFTRPMFAVPLLQPAAQAWETKYTYSCTPLLDRARKKEAARALLDVLGSVSPGEWVLPRVNAKQEACQAMLSALEERGLPSVFANGFSRPSLEGGSTFEEHMQRTISSSRRKSLARNRRRLEELGTVRHEAHSSGEGLDRAVSAFLTIEAGGWKGKRGTALACDEESRSFATAAFTGDDANSICRADMLTLNGEPIAVRLMVVAGGTGFTVKACYDESYRSYSPGILLEIEVVRSFLSEGWLDRLDGATTEAHVLDTLWSGQVEVADLLFSLSPHRPQLRLSALHFSERLRRKAWSTAKRSLNRLSDA